MSSISTDLQAQPSIEGPVKEPSASRKDRIKGLLETSEFRYLILVIMGMVAVFLYLRFPSGHQYLLCIIPGLIIGFVLSYYAYFTYGCRSVTLKVSDAAGNEFGAYKISQDRFSRMTRGVKVGFPGLGHDGDPVYHCKSVDFDKDVIELGYKHTGERDADVLLTHMDKMDSFIEDYEKKSEQIVEFRDLPFIKGSEYGRKFMEHSVELQMEFLGVDPSEEGDKNG